MWGSRWGTALSDIVWAREANTRGAGRGRRGSSCQGTAARDIVRAREADSSPRGWRRSRATNPIFHSLPLRRLDGLRGGQRQPPKSSPKLRRDANRVVQLAERSAEACRTRAGRIADTIQPVRSEEPRVGEEVVAEQEAVAGVRGDRTDPVDFFEKGAVMVTRQLDRSAMEWSRVWCHGRSDGSDGVAHHWRPAGIPRPKINRHLHAGEDQTSIFRGPAVNVTVVGHADRQHARRLHLLSA